MKVHLLKCPQPYFNQICYGEKKFEVRFNDRDFQVGDMLTLFEGVEDINPLDIDRLRTHVNVEYVLLGGQFGIEHGYCVMGITNTNLNSLQVINAKLPYSGSVGSGL